MVEQKKATREPSRERGRARRELLLATAKAMISEDRSLEGLTLQEIAKRAGVPRVSLYYFFPSVEALLETLYSEALVQMTNELAQTTFDSTIPWLKLIDTILDETRSHYERNLVTQILALSPLSFKLSLVRARGLTHVCQAPPRVRDCVRTCRHGLAKIISRDGQDQRHHAPPSQSCGVELP
ncbi:MAG: TetR/AcrR family transcriptional regulator [Gammaproteobacteria bacterium]|nr:TetR/AcrR family transcriptional regulator [Gammaproteobacteria bacterium]